MDSYICMHVYVYMDVVQGHESRKGILGDKKEIVRGERGTWNVGGDFLRGGKEQCKRGRERGRGE